MTKCVLFSTPLPTSFWPLANPRTSTSTYGASASAPSALFPTWKKNFVLGAPRAQPYAPFPTPDQSIVDAVFPKTPSLVALALMLVPMKQTGGGGGVRFFPKGAAGEKRIKPTGELFSSSVRPWEKGPPREANPPPVLFLRKKRVNSYE